MQKRAQLNKLRMNVPQGKKAQAAYLLKNASEGAALEALEAIEDAMKADLVDTFVHEVYLNEEWVAALYVMSAIWCLNKHLGRAEGTLRKFVEGFNVSLEEVSNFGILEAIDHYNKKYGLGIEFEGDPGIRERIQTYANREVRKK